MEYHPKDAPVGEEGFVTHGNVFTHNIAAYRDPKSTAFSVLRIPFTHASWPITEAEGAREHPLTP